MLVPLWSEKNLKRANVCELRIKLFLPLHFHFSYAAHKKAPNQIQRKEKRAPKVGHKSAVYDEDDDDSRTSRSIKDILTKEPGQ